MGRPKPPSQTEGLVLAFVQIGNEITSGLLWDEGRVGNNFDTPGQWENLASLLQAAIEGVDDALPAEQRPGIMIHIDRGGDNATARRFFDHLLAKGVAITLIEQPCPLRTARRSRSSFDKCLYCLDIIHAF